MYERGEWLINQSVIDRIKEEYGVDIRPLKKKASWKKEHVKMKYTGKYKEMADQFHKDGADEYQIEKFIRKEMERDALEYRTVLANGAADQEACEIWQSWPEERRKILLNNALCGNCGGLTSFAPGYTVWKDQWGLILDGKCAKCGGKIRRVCD